jgi:carbamoyltransferase
MTEYLGFEMLDGEYKVMGMAPYGDPHKYDLSRLAKFENGELVDQHRLRPTSSAAPLQGKGQGLLLLAQADRMAGPEARGRHRRRPLHPLRREHAEAVRGLALQMMDYYLGDILRETGRLAFAGGGALNVKLNQKIIARPEVKELFVQPASGDAGTAIGAASYVSVQRGVPVEKMEHVYLGPPTATRTSSPPAPGILPSQWQ